MRNKFDRELENLNNNLVTMGTLCENAISMAVGSFLGGNNTYHKSAYELEDKINTSEKKIEQQCLSLLLKQQPVARDLRIISAALKMITDLERIGDHAFDIAELCEYAFKISSNDTIKLMADESVKMVSGAINSFVDRNLELARNIILNDDIVDDLFVKTKDDIINKIRENSDDIHTMIDMLMIAKYLERIADHATNIAEWVEFSLTGKHREDN